MTPLEQLLAELAAGIPDLPGAACRGRHQLFDPPGEGVLRDEPAEVARRQAAITICNRCPVLDACAVWVASLPRRQRPVGVIAGCVITELQPSQRPRPTTAVPPKPRAQTKADLATTWLANHLAEHGGTDTSASITKAGAAAGHHRATLHTAGRRLGVEITKTSTRQYAPTTWRLPKEEIA